MNAGRLTSLVQMASNVQPNKMDTYLQSALASNFSNYLIGGATNPLISVGILLRVDSGGVATVIPSLLSSEFAKYPECRITTAQLAFFTSVKEAFITAQINLQLLSWLLTRDYVIELQLCSDLRVNRPLPIKKFSAVLPVKPVFRSSKKKILGLIDHGCAFANKAFRQGQGTRIAALWDQDACPELTENASTPEGFGYGAQLDAQALNKFISASTKNTSVDEALAYQLAGYTPMRHSMTHGTMTLSQMSDQWVSPSLTATKRSEHSQAGSDLDYVFVQLPRNIPLAPGRGNIERASLDGLAYIAQTAPDGATISVVIDYGTDMGPHDGSSWFERAVDQLVIDLFEYRKVQMKVVFPSGNSFVKKTHALLFSQAIQQPAEIGWWIPKGSEAASFSEIWLDASQAELSITVSPPMLSDIQLDFVQDQTVVWPNNSEPIFTATLKTIGGQRCILFEITPTTGYANRFVAPAGVWKFKLMAIKAIQTPVHFYTAWGGRNLGMPQRSFQSHFIEHKNGNCSVVGEGTILGSACGKHSWMAGGFQNWGNWDRASYSGAGAARGGKRKTSVPGADTLYPTEESAELEGLVCLGSLSAQRVRGRGTSFAAPLLAKTLLNKASLPKFSPKPTKPSGWSMPHPAEFGEPRHFL